MAAVAEMTAAKAASTMAEAVAAMVVVAAAAAAARRRRQDGLIAVGMQNPFDTQNPFAAQGSGRSLHGRANLRKV